MIRRQARLRGRRPAAAPVPDRRGRSWRWRSGWRRTSRTTAWPRFAAGVDRRRRRCSSVVLMILTPPLPAARLRAEPGDRPARGRRDAGLPAPAHAGHEHPGRRCRLLLGAVFSAYVFMPKRRVLPYSLDPTQPGDQFLFNLFIAPVGDRGQPRRVAAGRGARAVRRPAPLAGAGDAADRAGRILPVDHRLARPGRDHGAVRSSASSWAWCSCSPASSSPSRCSARSGSRSRPSGLGTARRERAPPP